MSTDPCLATLVRQDWLDDGPLDRLVVPYIEALRSQRYHGRTIRAYVGCLAHFSHWLACEATEWSAPDAASLVDRFLHDHLPTCACPAPCYCSVASSGAALRHLLKLLPVRMSMLSEVKTLNWLTKPEREQCEWTWSYLENYHRKENSDFRPGIPILFSFHPINDHEKFLAIYGVLRNWTAHKAEKTLLLKNMSRAWRERQRRQDQKEKKAINSYVDVKVKERLALLARYNRCQINEVLSDLINKEYRRLESEIRRQFD